MHLLIILINILISFHPGSSPPVSKSISVNLVFIPKPSFPHDLQLQPNSVIFDENPSFIQIEEGSQVVKINRLCRTHSQRKHKYVGLQMQIQLQIQMQKHCPTFYISNGRHTSASLSPLFISSKYQQQQQRVGWPHRVTFGHIYSPIFIYIHHPIYISIFNLFYQQQQQSRVAKSSHINPQNFCTVNASLCSDQLSICKRKDSPLP